MNSFESAFQYVMNNEGRDKYTDNSLDSGGPTKWGVSQSFLEKLTGLAIPHGYMETLTENQARTIFEQEFWGPLRCDLSAHDGVSIAISDLGYLEGVRTASLILQLVLKRLGCSIVVDGSLGSKSWAEVNLQNPKALLELLVHIQLAHFNTLISLNPKKAVFLNGWSNRVNRYLTLS